MSSSNGLRSPTRQTRLTAIQAPEEPGDDYWRWRLDFSVRGELVSGILHARQKLEPEMSLVVWVHAHEATNDQLVMPIGSIVLELQWPLLGPRQSPKLSPLLVQFLDSTLAGSSGGPEGLWRQFTQQATSEIEQSIKVVQDEPAIRATRLVEIRMQIDLNSIPSRQNHWHPSPTQPNAPGAVVRDFLESLRNRAN